MANQNWQRTVETGRIYKIGLAAQGTAAPTAPNTGSSLDWTATASGEACYGWTVFDGEFTEDDFEINDVDASANAIEIKPPSRGFRLDEIVDDIDAIDSIAFTSYEAGTKVMTLATNITESTGVFTKAASHTNVAVFLEWQGFGGIWMPNCKIYVGSYTGGFKKTATQAVMIKPFGTSSYESGHTMIQWQDA